VGLAVEACAIAFSLSDAIGDFVPKNRREHVETEGAASHLDVGMQWHHEMATALLARHAHIANDTADPTARHEHPIALAPHLIEFFQKRSVIREITELTIGARIVLERPVGR